MAQYIEQYVPVVKYNGGLQTALPAVFEGTIQFTGAPLGTNGRFHPIVSPNVAPTAYTTDTTLTTALINTNVTNTGAAGTITLTLPTAASSGTGAILHVELTVAQIVRVDPAGTESLYLGGSGVAGKYAQIAGVIGNMADFYCTGTTWMVVGRDGVVTKEA